MNKEVYGVIYLVMNKTNNKIYIGQTTEKGGFDKRYFNNIEKYTHNQHLKRSIKKYGIENFEIDKSFDVAYSKEELDKLEDMYIKIYNTTDDKYGYNKMFGGSHGKPSEETRLKMSKSSAKIWLGKHLSEETKKKIGQANKGNVRKLSSSEKIAISNRMKGDGNPNFNKHLSKETKNKLREVNSIKVICITTNKIFNSAKEGSEYYQCDTCNISKCCQGKLNICGKLEDNTPLIWMYYEEYLNITSEEVNNKLNTNINISRIKKVKCITTNLCFDSVKEAGEYYKTFSCSISSCCKGKLKSAGKLKDGTKLVWEYCA